MKRIHFVPDYGLHDQKAFYKVEIVFIHPQIMINNFSL